MPRHVRKKSETVIYHIILRGINKQAIFEEDEDKEKLFSTIKHYKTISQYKIYRYCFLDNHIHLLIKETVKPISTAIKRISGNDVYWYNYKYERCGHLFQERFKSEVVENEEYFLTVLRYIHQNPLNAELAKDVSDYSWTSYHEYIERPLITDVNFALKMFSNDKKKAIVLFEKYTNEKNDDKCLEYGEKSRVSDNEIRAYFQQFGIANISEFRQLEKAKRDEIIKAIKLIGGVIIRQLSRTTGISKSVVDRI